RRGPVAVSFTEPQRAVAGFAQPRGIREQGSKDGFQLTGRARNDAQDLGGRGLLLQSLGKLARALFELLFQFASMRLKLLFPLAARFPAATDTRFCLRSGRTKLATTCSAFRGLARQGHPPQHVDRLRLSGPPTFYSDNTAGLAVCQPFRLE